MEWQMIPYGPPTLGVTPPLRFQLATDAAWWLQKLYGHLPPEQRRVTPITLEAGYPPIFQPEVLL